MKLFCSALNLSSKRKDFKITFNYTGSNTLCPNLLSRPSNCFKEDPKNLLDWIRFLSKAELVMKNYFIFHDVILETRIFL